MTSIDKTIGSVYRRAKSRMGEVVDNGIVKCRNFASGGGLNDRLLILDDIFPQMMSAFRIAEYNAYLEIFQNAQVYSTATAFPLAGETRLFKEVVKEYENRYPQYRNKVLKYTRRENLRSRLVYTIFINNALKFIDVAERYRSAFVFTLYPGGGFCLWDKRSDSKLRRVLSSSSFRKVIVTQKISYDYLVDQELCPPGQIEFIYGGVLPSHLLTRNGYRKQRFPDDKDTFDICFVANKYTQQGVDKGYDIFVEVAKELSSISSDMVFHVVGPFDENDIDVGGIHQDRIHFHGTKYTESFPRFYARMDIILSPNRAFVLNPGGFDGFPTGACVEAGLCGVAVFCADPLQQNIEFQDGIDIVIIQFNIEEICAQVQHFYHRPDELYELSSKGEQAFRRVFGLSAQIEPRLEILSDLLNGN